MNILQFDTSINMDKFKYTVWILIYHDEKDLKLCTLDNVKIDFNCLGRSKTIISSDYLAKMSLIK